MKSWTHLALAVVASVSLACGGGDRTANDTAAPNAGGTAGTAGTAGASANVDEEFVQEQLADGDAEVALGRLVQEKASHPQVKEFGQMMIRDHQTSGAELKEIAAKHNVRVEGGEHNEHNDLRERLAKLSGAEFDREYMNAMVEDHERVVNKLEEKAQDAENPEVKGWASKTLPVVRQHLERARTIQQSLEQRGNTGANPGH